MQPEEITSGAVGLHTKEGIIYFWCLKRGGNGHHSFSRWCFQTNSRKIKNPRFAFILNITRSNNSLQLKSRNQKLLCTSTPCFRITLSDSLTTQNSGTTADERTWAQATDSLLEHNYLSNSAVFQTQVTTAVGAILITLHRSLFFLLFSYW